MSSTRRVAVRCELLVLARFADSCELCHNVTVSHFQRADISRLFGRRADRLPGWKSVRAPTSLSLSASPGSVPPATDHRAGPLLTRTDLEYLAAHQTPYRIAKAAVWLAERREERLRERARLAGVLLRANLSTPGKRFSMADAGLARVAASGAPRPSAAAPGPQGPYTRAAQQCNTSAPVSADDANTPDNLLTNALARAGATNGNGVSGDGQAGENAQPGASGEATRACPADVVDPASLVDCDIPNKAKLRGEARKASRAAVAKLAPLPPSTLGKVRGNGTARVAKVKQGARSRPGVVPRGWGAK